MNNGTSFANRVVLITGAGSGIGRQMALALAGEGALVGALDLKPDGLATLAAELSGRQFATAVGHILGAVRLRRAFFAFPGPSVRRVRLLRWLPAGASDWLVRRMMADFARKQAKAE